MNKNEILEFLKNKKVQWAIIGILFLIILISSSLMRTQNIPLLVDETTGENIPTALDPFYFLRMAETIIQQGSLPDVDVMRYPSAQVGFSPEILPQVLVFMYKFANIFGDFTLNYIDIISPVIFFFLGLIVYFFLICLLTNSKLSALISSFFLAFIPSYLYRTTAGFSDHEAIGMFAMISAFLILVLSIKFLENKNTTRKNILFSFLFGLGTAFLTAFSISSWGGGARFIFMIFPVVLLLLWVFKTKDNQANLMFVLYYIILFIFSVIFSMILGFSFSAVISNYYLGLTGMIGSGIFIFVIIDFIMMNLKNKFSFLDTNIKRMIFSGIVTIILGFVFLIFKEGNPFFFISTVISSLLHPFGTGRTGLTVSENAQPYLVDWISQTGSIFFWLFFAGLIVLGFEFGKKLRLKNKILFVFSWILFVVGLIFSRYSANSIFNGTNFISQLFYFGSMILFFGFLIYLYIKEKDFYLDSLHIFILGWMILMLIAGRGAVRLFFAMTPFFTFIVGFSFVKLIGYFRRSKEDVLRIFLAALLIVGIIAMIFSANNLISSSNYQAKYTGPTANVQWQKAMGWVRENTAIGSIFLHWWDYGYWVEYLGERPSVTDGGHAIGYWDHLIGRYVLTTPYPETALSFMKTQNVSYLLIDSTDLGKYPAYSIIGDDEEKSDRYSWLTTLIANPSQTVETGSGKLIVYSGGYPTDEDIFYDYNGKQILLPQGKTYVIGVTLEVSGSENLANFKQPTAVYYYNNVQYKIPLRYLSYRDSVMDFNTGLEAGIKIIPYIQNNGGSASVDNLGTIIYISPRTFNSLFVQLYLLNDYFKKYPTLNLAHSEDNYIIESLNLQGGISGEFAYYQGFLGPIKIWSVDVPDNIIVRDEFLREDGGYGEFDNLQFVN